MQAAAIVKPARKMSVVITKRVRPTPWVQVKRKVPDSNSRERSGAPTKTPMTTGNSWRTTTRDAKASVPAWMAL